MKRVAILRDGKKKVAIFDTLSQFWKSATSSLNGILLGSLSDVILKGIMLLAEVNVNVLNCLICFLIFCRNETHI